MTVTQAPRVLSIDVLKQMSGQEVGCSSWFLVDQARIDAFADVTQDRQFIHVDPLRAAKTPFGGTIAHGFLTLSLLSAMGLEAQPKIESATMGINYGFDRIRFLSPVRVGSWVRGRFVLANVREVSMSDVDILWKATVEIEGEARPALKADWLIRFYLSKDGEAKTVC